MLSTKFKLTVHFHFLLNQAKLALYDSGAQNRTGSVKLN
jgi:hypothetical protein